MANHLLRNSILNQQIILTDCLFFTGRCEHYDRRNNRDHMLLYIDSSFDVEYLEAYLQEDTEEVDRIETEAHTAGYGPLGRCSTIVNTSSKRLACRKSVDIHYFVISFKCIVAQLHRARETGELRQPLLERMQCTVSFRLFEPLEQYRVKCPWVLVVVKGVHEHPIPLPQTTPFQLRDALFTLFHRLGHELADLTPRRFLRHPVLIAFLHEQLPGIQTPVLSDLHVSLANRTHLKVYIDQAKALWFPHGTGYQGTGFVLSVIELTHIL